MNMTTVTRAPGGNHGNFHLFGNGTCQFQVVPCLGSIGVHAGDEEFASTALLNFFCPKDGVFTRVFPSTSHVDIPTWIIWVLAASGINGNDDALVTEAIACLINKVWIAYRRRINADFISSSS